jgi:hypothetical protein
MFDGCGPSFGSLFRRMHVVVKIVLDLMDDTVVGNDKKAGRIEKLDPGRRIGVTLQPLIDTLDLLPHDRVGEIISPWSPSGQYRVENNGRSWPVPLQILDDPDISRDDGFGRTLFGKVVCSNQNPIDLGVGITW